MSRRLYTLPLAVGLLALTFAAHAEVFKCKDATGRIIYGEKNEPKMQCTPVTAEITVVPAVPVTRPATPPSPNPADTQRQELQNKIKEQEQALADAKKNLAEQESIRLRTEVFYQSVLDRLKPYQDKVAELEKALDQSRAELNNLK
jgi:septal ring factor EnvC (AmiA/AmiB activator)